MSGECMSFPATPAEFIESYSFKDKEQVYTNGVELIPVFRVEQMLEHYFQTVHADWYKGAAGFANCGRCNAIINPHVWKCCPVCMTMIGKEAEA